MNKQADENQTAIEQQLDTQLNPQPTLVMEENETAIKKEGKPCEDKIPEKALKVLSVGEWMITILFFLLPGVNLVMMALWAFSSRGNVHRRNLSRACLLWWIIILIAYVVAMTIAGFTIFDIFKG
ncbi:MAG: hypothetical protein PHC69_02250 [Ruminiclostridium sp.]|nr:hypothetical protein [Ruminiclostridium sp.]